MASSPTSGSAALLERSTDVGLLLLRAGAGALMFPHGLAKLERFDALWTTFPDPLGLGSAPSLCLAIFAEVVCSILLVLGAATRFAALPLLTTMLVAVLVVHADDPFARRELPLLYGLVFLSLALLGPGRLSLDGAHRARREARQSQTK